jgi:hypothetical protein
METYLNKEQLDNLAEVFANEEQFTEHLKTLWALRELLYNKIETECPDTFADHPLYRIFDLTNKVIGAIDDGTVSIVNGEIRVDKSCKWR